MNLLEAEFSFTEQKARTIANSLKLESKENKRERSKTTVTSRGDKLKLKIEAPDLHALRAAVNTYLKWIIMGDELA